MLVMTRRAIGGVDWEVCSAGGNKLTATYRVKRSDEGKLKAPRMRGFFFAPRTGLLACRRRRRLVRLTTPVIG
jgi:hypothetical protein